MILLLDFIQDSVKSSAGYDELQRKLAESPLISPPTTVSSADRVISLAGTKYLMDDAKATPFYGVIRALHLFHSDKERESDLTASDFSSHENVTIGNILKYGRKHCEERINWKLVNL